MCLITSKFIHPNSNGKVKCLVAQEDILVYKCLDCIDGEYCTPYQCMRLSFTKGKYVYKKVNMVTEAICTNCGRGMSTGINVGIHAYGTKGAAIAYSKSFHNWYGTSMHYAIIPKGSNFYIGQDEDVVSNNLIVYREKRCFDKHYKGTIDIKEYMKKYNLYNK